MIERTTPRYALWTIITLVLAPPAAAVTSPTCILGGIQNCEPPTADLGPVAILGDVLVGPGETERYDNGTYAAAGEMEVQGGGTLEIDNATFRFTESSDGIVVRSGGTIIIKRSDLGAAGDARDDLVIEIRDGATATLKTSSFRGLTVRVQSEITSLDLLVFEGSPLALVLEAVDVTLERGQFDANDASVLVLGGAPTIIDNEFRGGGLAIDVQNAAPTIELNDFLNVDGGIRMVGSQGAIELNELDDKAGPPTFGTSVGLEIVNPSGATTVADNLVQEWGTGIRLCDPNSRVTLSNNFFANNGANVQSVC